jgi:hypothetical protein
LIATLILSSLLKKKKAKSAQYRFLCEQRSEIAAWVFEGVSGHARQRRVTMDFHLVLEDQREVGIGAGSFFFKVCSSCWACTNAATATMRSLTSSECKTWTASHLQLLSSPRGHRCCATPFAFVERARHPTLLARILTELLDLLMDAG